jgi:hypothetical protein
MLAAHLGTNVDRYDGAGYAMIVLGICILALAGVGEVLGWWNDAGETLGIIGVVVTGLGVLLSLLVGSTRAQVASVSDGMRQVSGDVRQVGEDVREVRSEVRAGNAKLDHVVMLLTQIRDRL